MVLVWAAAGTKLLINAFNIAFRRYEVYYPSEKTLHYISWSEAKALLTLQFLFTLILIYEVFRKENYIIEADTDAHFLQKDIV